MKHVLALFLLLAAPAALAQRGAPQADAPADEGPTEHHRTATLPGEAFFRTAPSEEADLLGLIPAGTEVRLAVCAQAWCPVLHEGEHGFIHVDDVYPGSSITGGQAPPWEAAPAPARAAISEGAASSEAASSETVSEEGFVASKNSRVFHRAGCSHAARIAEHNRVRYESAAEAEAEGRRPCRVCHPSD